MSLNSFSIGTFLLVTLLGAFQIKLYTDIKEIRSDISYIKKNYTPMTIVRQRAQFVDLQVEDLTFGIMDASILAKEALNIVYPDSTADWYVGLTTEQIDSIRLNCQPIDYYNVATEIKLKEMELFNDFNNLATIQDSALLAQ